jgi:hypothetical protein
MLRIVYGDQELTPGPSLKKRWGVSVMKNSDLSSNRTLKTPFSF